MTHIEGTGESGIPPFTVGFLADAYAQTLQLFEHRLGLVLHNRDANATHAYDRAGLTMNKRGQVHVMPNGVYYAAPGKGRICAGPEAGRVRLMPPPYPDSHMLRPFGAFERCWELGSDASGFCKAVSMRCWDAGRGDGPALSAVCPHARKPVVPRRYVAGLCHLLGRRKV